MASVKENVYYPGRSKVVLVVDDKPEVREILSMVLTMYGYLCVEASNGCEAELLYASTHIDLVVTDINMPEKNGLSLIEDLKVADPEVKIIAMSGSGSEGQLPDCLEWAKMLGASNAFVKPFNPVNFMKIIDSVLYPSNEQNQVLEFAEYSGGHAQLAS
jgi:two-component system, chemotaxis family, chemotaxis protein CheY